MWGLLVGVADCHMPLVAATPGILVGLLVGLGVAGCDGLLVVASLGVVVSDPAGRRWPLLPLLTESLWAVGGDAASSHI